MSASESRVRRATVDDLSRLIPLWESMRYSPVELERRLTEFQVIEGVDGTIHGTIGLEINVRQGRLHSECFGDFSLSEAFRELLWSRMQNLTANHGISRLWIQETAPYWKQLGFHPATPEELTRLPAAWIPLPNEWLTLRLKAEEAFESPVEKEFEQFKAMERARTEQALARTKLANQIATMVAVILALLIMVASIYVWVHRTRLPSR